MRLRLAAFSAVCLLSAAAPLLAQEADVGLVQSGPGLAAPGSNVTYEIEVVNAGPDPATSVEISDPIPGGMTFVSHTQTSGPVFTLVTPAVGAGGTVTASLGSMNVGDRATFSLTLKIDAGTAPGTWFTRIASVSATTPDPNEENDSGAAATMTPDASFADVGVVVNGPVAALPNANVVYTITVVNNGPGTSGATLTQTLPGDMTFVSMTHLSGPTFACTGPAVGAGGTITCTHAAFAPSAVTLFQLVGKIPPGTASGTTYELSSTATSSADPTEENDTATTSLTVSSSDLAVVTTGDASVVAGQNLTYTFTVANNGADAAPEITLLSSLPADTTFVSFAQTSGPALLCSVPAIGGSGSITCSAISGLTSGQTATFTLTLRVDPSKPQSSVVTNSASVFGGNGDPNLANNVQSVSATVLTSADLGVTAIGPANVEAGRNATYNLTVTNAGPSAASNVTLSAAFPAGTTFVSATGPAGWSCSAGITCTASSMLPGTATFTVVIRPPKGSDNGSTMILIAEVSAATTDPVAANNSATATAIVVAPIPSLDPPALALLAIVLAIGGAIALNRAN